MTTIVNVLNNEVDRVNDRKTAIDNAEEERKRIIALTSSATERQRAYNTIYAVIVAMLLGVVIIKMLYRFEFVPDVVLDILIAVVVSAGLIYSLLLYSDIMRRSNMDFSLINFDDAPTKSQAQLDKEFKDKIASGNLGGIASENDGKCNGAETIYNKMYGVCYPKTVPANITIPKDTSTTAVPAMTVGSTTVTVNSKNTVATTITAAHVTALTTLSNYKYCRKKDGSYAWLPVSASNVQIVGTELTDVTPADPNYVNITDRKIYVAETLSTYPAGQRPGDSFTTLEHSDGVSIAPFSSNNLYAKYI